MLLVTGNSDLSDTLIMHFCLGKCNSVKLFAVLVNTSEICLKLMTSRDFGGCWSTFSLSLKEHMEMRSCVSYLCG